MSRPDPNWAGQPSSARRAELSAALERVERRLVEACAQAGRRRDEVHLIAVTKTFPACDAQALVELGVTDLGENRDQDAREKAARVTGARWHFVGRLQANKARSVASYAELVHSLDRPALVDALAAGALRAGRRLDVLLQLSLDGDPARGGAAPGEVPALAEAVLGAQALRLCGVMAVAPAQQDPLRAFAELASVAARLRTQAPQASVISAGMSGDLEQAVAAGATHVRIGSALLGRRPDPAG